MAETWVWYAGRRPLKTPLCLEPGSPQAITLPGYPDLRNGAFFALREAGCAARVN
jgi:hypothetical protein